MISSVVRSMSGSCGCRPMRRVSRCLGCRALQQVANSRLTSRFQGVPQKRSLPQRQTGVRERPCLAASSLRAPNPGCRGLREVQAVARTRRPNRPRSLADRVDHDTDHPCNSTTAGLFIPQSIRAPVVHPDDRARGIRSRGEHGERRARRFRRPRCRGAERGRWDARASHEGSRPHPMGCGPPGTGRAGLWPRWPCGGRLRGLGAGRLGGSRCLASVVVEDGARLSPQRPMALQHNRLHRCREMAGVAHHDEG